MHSHQIQRSSLAAKAKEISKSSDLEHADDFDFNQKDGTTPIGSSQAELAARLVEDAKSGKLTQEMFEKLLNSNQAQAELINQLKNDIIGSSADVAKEKMQAILENATAAFKSGNPSDLDPHLLKIVQAQQQDGNDPNAIAAAGYRLGAPNTLPSSISGDQIADPGTSNTSASIDSLFGNGNFDIANFRGSIAMLLVMVGLALALQYENTAKIQIRMFTANKQANDKVQEAASAMQDLQSVLGDKTLKMPCDLADILNDPSRSGQVANLKKFLKNQGDWNGDPNTLSTSMQAAIHSANGYANQLANANSTVPSSDNDLLPENSFVDPSSGKISFTTENISGFISTASTAAGSAATLLQNNTGVSNRYSTNLQATNQSVTQAYSMAASGVTLFNQLTQIIYK